MDCRRRPDPEAPGSPPRLSSSLLRDVSNYKTPKPRPTYPDSCPSPIFFTASKATPHRSSVRRRPLSSASRSIAAATRCLKALELDQCQSARKAQIRRQRTLQSFSRSIAAWLNFLFQNPKSCGSNFNLDGWSDKENFGISQSRKRENLGGEAGGVGIGRRRWRSPKRQRSCDGSDRAVACLGPRRFSALEVSLEDVCSFEDMKERMSAYMSEKSCDEVFSMMSHVCKNIDEGRLKMKSHCPIVTDLGLKAKATAVLMCYNPVWLRIGLHIVLGGDSLLLNEGGESDQNGIFLKMIIEKQFFSHVGMAKQYSYNRLVDGLYRPGYFEALGSIILKRFLLLVIALDKAKCESTLPLKYGIDGIDGGSPMLFCRSSHIKSSRQVIQEFLSEAMHGEGDLLAHLIILGCKVNHQQSPLSEYGFSVTNQREDFQDGILLCRAIQLLQCDASILSKLIVPSDTRKKNLHNCNIAMTYLKQARVPLCDRDGIMIVAEDVVNGDKELLPSILWNVFVHLQVPMLINRITLVEEISKFKGSDASASDCDTKADFSLLLDWIQAVSECYNVKVDNLYSLNDGKALCCLLDYYLNVQLKGRHSLKESQNEHCKGFFKLLNPDGSSSVYNLLLVQHVAAKLGNIPEVLQASDILDQDKAFDERSVMVLLVFLAAELINRKMLGAVPNPPVVPLSPLFIDGLHLSYEYQEKNMLDFDSLLNKDGSEKYKSKEWGAIVIQSQFRRYIEQKKYTKIKHATFLAQDSVRAWLSLPFRSSFHPCPCSIQPSSEILSGVLDRHLKSMIERHKFVRTKASVLQIQRAVRSWIKRRQKKQEIDRHIPPNDMLEVQNQNLAAIKIQASWRRFTVNKLYLQQKSSATIIQKNWRCWFLWKNFLCEVHAIVDIQTAIRSIIEQTRYSQYKMAAVRIQRFGRGHLARKKYQGASSLRNDKQHKESFDVNQKFTMKGLQLILLSRSALKLQRWWRVVLLHRSQLHSAIIIQSYFRGFIARKEADRQRHSISMIQLWWRNILFHSSQKRYAVIIQAHVRGWIARREASRNKDCIVVIQSYWKGYLARKYSRQQLADLCARLTGSIANEDDYMRLINRLVSELKGCKSISNIRHTCATLDMATNLAEKRCETLVAAGALSILLEHFHLLNRGVPDQEILKHVLSILRNIARYSQLTQVLIRTPQSVETIFQELLRNKNEGFFIASDILKKIFALQEGLEAARKLQGHVRRLNNLAQELERKAELMKRKASLAVGRDATLQRLREVENLLQLIAGSHQLLKTEALSMAN